MTALPARKAPIVIGGCGRSGTTLLRVILDTHPSICCGPESGLLFEGGQAWRRPDSLAEKFAMPPCQITALSRRCETSKAFAKEFFEAYRVQCAKARWAEKTPKNVRFIAYILETFPDAVFLHAIRDGRDVACSLRTHPLYRFVDGRLEETGNWNPFEDGVRRWVQDVKAGVAFRGHERYLEVRYEDLVLRPEPTLRQLLQQLGEDWDPCLLSFANIESASRRLEYFPQNQGAKRPLFVTSVGRWRRDATVEDLRIFERIGGGLLAELGYP